MKETGDLLTIVKEELKKRVIKVTTEVRKGSPANEILEVSKKYGVDLIVIGSHGRHGIERLFLGSVSLRVAEYAPCSVLIIR